MENMRLGRTNIIAARTGFGALPIQRIPVQEAVYLLRKAYDSGINFYDTARAYSDSEEKIGTAFVGMRDKVFIATKTQAQSKQGLLTHLETSLRNLRTDYIDILQLHNPEELPNPDDPNSLYAGLVEARQKGWVRYIGITNHRFQVALDTVHSGLYDTVQFPLSILASPQDLTLIEECKQHDIGLIAMKALSGGLITNAAVAFAFLRQYKNVMPIWGVQREHELDQFIALEANPPVLDAEMEAIIEHDRAELAGNFCRGCGYCLPCPAEIPIPMAARMSLLLRRAPYQQYTTPEWQEQMARIDDCQNCEHCSSNCPYGLDTPELLRVQLEDYRAFNKQIAAGK